jgi:sortase A
MPDHHEGRSGRRASRLLLWAERLLVTAGVATLIWCAVIVTDAAIAQRMARDSLQAAAAAERPLLPPLPAPPTEAPSRDPAAGRGSAIAALSIPRVHLSTVVLHGSDSRTLRRGPGHLENTAWPGDSGNVVIAGHRDSFFWPLRHIQRGDDIFLDTPEEQFHYRVTSLRVVDPHDVSVLAPTNEATLTLITCYPFWVLGSAPDRFVVRAVAVVDEASEVPFAREPTRPLESIPGPLVEEPASTESVDQVSVAVHDDDSLVRQAVERFRLAYNARLSSRNEVDSGGPLRFSMCDIVITDDRATAICEARGQSFFDPHARVFTLDRAVGGWAIKSIVLK